MMRSLISAAFAAACLTSAIPPALATGAASPRAFAEAGGSIDLRSVDQLVGDAPIVILGEDSHRQQAIHQLVPLLFRHLVEKKGFRTFVFESGWAMEDVVNGFLASDRTTLNERETYFLNAFKSEPITEMLLWARQYNAAHPKDPIRFTGFQPEQPATDAEALRAFAARAPAFGRAKMEATLTMCDLGQGKYASDVAVILAQNAERLAGKPGFTAEERAACLAGLERIAADLDAARPALERQTSRAAVEEAKLHARSIGYFVGPLNILLDKFMIRGGSKDDLAELIGKTYGEIDEARFEIFQALRRTRGARKTFLWMHNFHATRAGDTVDLVHNNQLSPRAVTIGQRLAREYGTRLVSIGTIVPCENCGEPAGSLEPLFQKRFGNHVTLVDFRSAAAKQLPIGSPGILYAQGQGAGTWLDKVDLSQNFDGIIYLPNADALPPTRARPGN